MATALGILGLVLAGALWFFGYGPGGLRARYRRDVAARMPQTTGAPVVTERDLAPLPPAVSRYLRFAGVVGQPRVTNFRAHFRGRIRSGPAAPWMPLRVEQTSFVDPPARFFLMNATRSGIPVIGLHRYVGPTATMLVKVLGVFPVVSGKGPQMDLGETVTLFNDMCLFAPATLLDSGIRWSEAGPDTVRATFMNAGHTIGATLVFGAAGELVDFTSDDRACASADGRSFTAARWSTPVREYRAFGAHHLLARGEARWHPAGGEYTYIELELLDIRYDLTAP